jgi:hypothetical protein
MKVDRTTRDLPADRRIKAFAGSLLTRLRPGLSAAVDAAPFDPAWGPAAKLIRNAHLADAVRRGDHETLRRYFTHYWSSATSVEFYEGFAHRFEELFLRHHSLIADHLGDALRDLGEGPVRLVEVGSGDGRVLEWFAEQLPGIATFHGVDLNDREIRKCRENHRDSSRLFFHSGDLLAWLRANPAPRTVLVTNGGVFEYLLEEELRTLFTELRSLCSPCLVAVTESIGDDHDLENETFSLPYGHEFAFSHNYPAILREAGFAISWERNRPTEPGEENHPVRWYQLLAGSMSGVSRRLPTEGVSAFLFMAAQFAVG